MSATRATVAAMRFEELLEPGAISGFDLPQCAAAARSPVAAETETGPAVGLVAAGPAPQDGAWGIEAHTAFWRAYPDGSMEYRHPVTGEILTVDAVLSLPVLNRLNRIQGISIMNVCAGHGFGHISKCAALGFCTTKELGLYLVEQLEKSRNLQRLSVAPGLHCFSSGAWMVSLGCRMLDQESNHVVWWECVARALARLVRRYHVQQWEMHGHTHTGDYRTLRH